MIIGIDISQLPYSTGVSRYTLELVVALLRKYHTQHQFKLFAGVFHHREVFEQFFASLTKEGLSFQEYLYPLPPKLAALVWNNLHLAPIDWFIGKTDIFHASDWTQPPVKAKTVTTVHDLTPLLFPEHHDPLVVTNFKRRMHWVTKSANHVLTDSDATKKDLLKHYAIGADQVTTVPLAMAAHFKPVASKEKIQEVLGKYHLKTPYFLSVGTLEPRKNIQRVIEAFQNLAHKEIQLVIVGKKGWKEKYKIPNTQHNIHVTGFVTDEDLPALYTGALAFVYPSLYEGFGLPVLEAMACGTPVITSDVSSLPEVAGKAAILVHPESIEELTQAMSQFIHQPKLREQLSKKSLQQATLFSWGKTARMTMDVYNKVR